MEVVVHLFPWFIAIIAILFLAVRKTRSIKELEKIVERVESVGEEITYFKVFQFPLEKIETHHFIDGRTRIGFCVQYLKKIEDWLYIIGLKAKNDGGFVAFDLVFNSKTMVFENDKSDEKFEYHNVFFSMPGVEGDNFFRLLCNVFEIEVGTKEQAVPHLNLFMPKDEITVERLSNDWAVTLFFITNSDSISTPCVKLYYEAEIGKLYLEEVSLMFRPLIAEFLRFKPNLKH